MFQVTADPVEAPLTRLVIEPSPANGLEQLSRLMIDKVVTVPRSNLGEHIGRLADDDMVQVNRALVVFLGVAG